MMRAMRPLACNHIRLAHQNGMGLMSPMPCFELQ